MRTFLLLKLTSGSLGNCLTQEKQQNLCKREIILHVFLFFYFLIPDSQCLKITVLVMELKHLFFSIQEIPVIHKVTKFRLETEEKYVPCYIPLTLSTVELMFKKNQVASLVSSVCEIFLSKYL